MFSHSQKITATNMPKLMLRNTNWDIFSRDRSRLIKNADSTFKNYSGERSWSGDQKVKKIKALRASGLSFPAISRKTGIRVGKCHAVA